MKLCQKCVNDTKMLWIATGAPNIRFSQNFRLVSEGECEFWAHKNLNSVIDFIDKTINSQLDAVLTTLKKMNT